MLEFPCNACRYKSIGSRAGVGNWDGFIYKLHAAGGLLDSASVGCLFLGFKWKPGSVNTNANVEEVSGTLVPSDHSLLSPQTRVIPSPPCKSAPIPLSSPRPPVTRLTPPPPPPLLPPPPPSSPVKGVHSLSLPSPVALPNVPVGLSCRSAPIPPSSPHPPVHPSHPPATPPPSSPVQGVHSLSLPSPVALPNVPVGLSCRSAPIPPSSPHPPVHPSHPPPPPLSHHRPPHLYRECTRSACRARWCCRTCRWGRAAGWPRCRRGSRSPAGTRRRGPGSRSSTPRRTPRTPTRPSGS